MLASDNIKSQSKWDKVAVYADITTKFWNEGCDSDTLISYRLVFKQAVK